MPELPEWVPRLPKWVDDIFLLFDCDAPCADSVWKLVGVAEEMADTLERLIPDECYGGEVEDAAQCATCQLRDNCDRYMVLRVLAKWRGEVPSGE